MKQYYLIGSPIRHSLSPRMMNSSFQKLSLDAHYDLLETDESSLAETVEKLRREGASGWNVTMPCKSGMALLCDELSVASRIGGSVNTVKAEGGKLIGHTTDGIGLTDALSRAGVPVAGSTLTLLGTGGAASAILIQAALDGADTVYVFANRPASRARALEIAEKLKAHSATRIHLCSYTDPELLRSALRNSRILINATNVGMQRPGDSGPSCLIPDAGYLHRDLFVYDIIYHPEVTPLLAMAAGAGCRCENGLSMLLGQGAASFRIWTGLTMPLDDLRSDLLS